MPAWRLALAGGRRGSRSGAVPGEGAPWARLAVRSATPRTRGRPCGRGIHEGLWPAQDAPPPPPPQNRAHCLPSGRLRVLGGREWAARRGTVRRSAVLGRRAASRNAAPLFLRSDRLFSTGVGHGAGFPDAEITPPGGQPARSEH